jgi:SAM-dependent methyltransferase
MDYRDFKQLTKKSDNHFWYRARRRLIKYLLSEILKPGDSSAHILEIGCGTGSQLSLLQGFGKVEGLDIEPEAIALARQNGFDAKVFDLEKDNFPNNNYRAIVAFDVLEHLQDDTATLKKISAALAPDGYFFFTVPANRWLFSPHDQAMGHYRRYSQKEIKAKITAAGLQVEEIGRWNFWLFPAIILMRLIKRAWPAKNQPRSESRPLPPIINCLLYRILNTETALIKRRIKLPWGLTIYGRARK